MMMHWKLRGWMLAGMLLAVVTVSAVAQSAIATTTVTDTIYRADGTAATGTVLITWSAFSSATGQTVPSGSTSVTIATGGLLSVQLAPNAGATPIGSYYTAVYHLDDGTVSREFWVVPSSQTAVHLSAVKSTVLPTSVAMQTVSKSYVDTAIATAISGHPLDSSTPYVLKSGDTMTGALTLPGDPTSPLQAAEKQYVDTNVSALASGLAQKVATLPAATQTVAQPAGTMLETNRLNGVEYASQYISGRGGNGIANAVASTDCAGGCEVKAEQNYASTELYTSTQWNDQTHVEDTRGGQRRDTYMNPASVVTPGLEAGQVVDVTSTHIDAMLQSQVVNEDPGSVGLMINHRALAGGSNQFPQGIDSQIPYFKTGYSALEVNGTYNTQGQHVLAPMVTNCYGVGDCLIGSHILTASGGFRDNADEGTHPMDLQVREDTQVFQGTCSSGCATGSTSVTVAVSSAAGTQGDGRFLIDKNPAKVLTAGVLTGAGVSGPHASAAFSGSAFPVSVFFQTAQAIPSQANNIAPGTVTVAIATSGVTTGFATNTVAAPQTSGVACVSDAVNGTNAQNYEMANYTVVDATHLQMTLNKAHNIPATVAIGGLCGYGLEQTADTASGIRQVFPVVGSYSATGLYYAGGATAILGTMGHTSAYLNLSLNVASIARSSNVVTVTTAGNLPADVNALTLTVSGVTDSSYNGSYVVTTTGPNTLTYAQNGANSTSTGGTMTVLTGGYALYPMAEVLSVLDAATKSVDGQMTLAPNTVAWAANDAVEQPHYYQQEVSADLTYVGQTTPRPSSYTRAGMQYEGNNGPGLQGWTVTNATPATAYFGNGGTHAAPDWAYEAKGVWGRTMSLDAGEQSVFTVHCNSHGCGKWNSHYNLFELDSSVATDTVAFDPTTSSLTMTLRGTPYGFTPQGLTAGTVNAATINATTINATTINGAVNGSNITSGTIGAARLPVFGASGSGHAQGVVPDPGATAGTTRYLREDGTWATPSGSSGSTALSTGLDTGIAALTGVTADYNFMQGSGTTVTDNSGSGNTATLGSGTNAPTWLANGLSFTVGQNVALPASLNSTQTFFFGVYINPVVNVSQLNNSFPMLIGASNGVSGLNLLTSQPVGGLFNANVSGLAYVPSIYANGVKSAGTKMLSGFHVLAYVLGTGSGSLDHFYIDGAEQTPYQVQGSSAGMQTTGNLFLGASNVSPFGSAGFLGTMYRFIAMPTNTLTASQIREITGQIQSDVLSRGVSLTPQPVTQTGATLNCIGDSITAGFGATTPFCSELSLTNQSYTITNWGIPNLTLNSIVGAEANRVAPLCSTTAGPSNAVVFSGTNDFVALNGTASSVFSNLVGEIQTLKLAGCKVFVGTMLSRTGQDASKDAYDALILSQGTRSGADGIVDFAANPLLGADGAYANTTWFNADGIHPTTAGQALLATALSNSLNYYYGSTLANPDVVTATTYQMLSSDGAVTAAPVANAAYTMPDCTGPSGATYTISNPQSTYAVTVMGLASQPINGITTAITIPSNSTVTLRDVPNPKSGSGCHWVM